MNKTIRNFVKKSANAVGLDIVRLPRNPQQTLLGLRALPIRTVIDVGANRGQFAEYITRFFPQAQLYCFEPLAEPFQQLRSWVDRQAPGRVHTFDVAIGETDGTAEMFYHTDHSPSSSILGSTDVNKALFPFTKQQVRVTVPMTTLDNALQDVTLSSDILMKLDVQGYEDRVIRGGTETFRQAKACIVEVSLDRLYEKQADVAEIFFLLDKLCYCNAGNLQQVYADDGHVIYFDAVFIKK